MEKEELEEEERKGRRRMSWSRRMMTRRRRRRRMIRRKRRRRRMSITWRGSRCSRGGGRGRGRRGARAGRPPACTQAVPALVVYFIGALDLLK